MENDYEFWEERYHREGRRLHQPDDFLLCYGEQLRGPRILDVAMGEGRNAIFLARLGFKVTGIDRSPMAVAKAKIWAEQEGLDITALEVDLEQLVLPEVPYDSIVVTRYWQPNLCEVLCRALKPEGILLYETYTQEYLKYPHSRSHSGKHFVRSGELRDAFAPHLEILHYAEVDKPQTRECCAQLLARRRV